MFSAAFMARLAKAVESMQRGRGLDLSPALRRRRRPAIRIERLGPDQSELGGALIDVLVAAVCAVGVAALWLW